MPTRPRRQMPRKRVVPAYVQRRRAGYGGLFRRRRLITPSGPTFTETYLSPVNGGVIVGNAGGIFQVRISDIPQVADYQTLYRQYRINWVKVMLVPDFAGTSIDINQVYAQNNAGGNAAGAPRIAFVVNDTPGLAAPANEGEVLEDNGCRIQSLLRGVWSKSFRPVPDKSALTLDAQGQPLTGVYVRERKQPFLSFAAPQLPGNNPLHNGISYWISHLAFGQQPAVMTWKVYYKVNFSLRDPQ